MKKLKRYLVIIISILVIVVVQELQKTQKPEKSETSKKDYASAKTTNISLKNAYRNRQSKIQVSGSGIVKKVLRDDLVGLRHQRFILEVNRNQTILIAHNIDIAPRIDNLQPGGKVSFCGEYVWDKRGGIVHWTHRDPSRRHRSGWLKYNGKTYQ